MYSSQHGWWTAAAGRTLSQSWESTDWYCATCTMASLTTIQIGVASDVRPCNKSTRLRCGAHPVAATATRRSRRDLTTQVRLVEARSNAVDIVTGITVVPQRLSARLKLALQGAQLLTVQPPLRSCPSSVAAQGITGFLCWIHSSTQNTTDVLCLHEKAGHQLQLPASFYCQ
jgi:hypothetical protein